MRAALWRTAFLADAPMNHPRRARIYGSWVFEDLCLSLGLKWTALTAIMSLSGMSHAPHQVGVPPPEADLWRRPRLVDSLVVACALADRPGILMGQ